MSNFINGVRLFFFPSLSNRNYTRHFNAPARYLKNAYDVEEKEYCKQQKKKR